MEASRRAMLLEKKKDIERQLGTGKGAQSVDKFKARLKGKSIPKEVQTVIDEEFERMAGLEPHSSEYSYVRAYLDWLTCLPWG